jgi:hypothetical protein
MRVQLSAPVSPSDLSDVVWALARLRFSPDESWMTHLTTAINRQLQGFSLQGLAVVIWGYTRLGFRPDRLWLLRFRAMAGPAGQEGSGGGSSSSSSSSGEQLAQFVAAFLALQNRQRFAEGRPDLKGRGTATAAAAARGGGRGRGRTAGSTQQQQQQQRQRQQQQQQQW